MDYGVKKGGDAPRNLPPFPVVIHCVVVGLSGILRALRGLSGAIDCRKDIPPDLAGPYQGHFAHS